LAGDATSWRFGIGGWRWN